MSKEVIAESSPATETPADFRSYLSLKGSVTQEKPAVGDKPEETASESAPEKKPQERKELTPEERSERDQRRNERKYEKMREAQIRAEERAAMLEAELEKSRQKADPAPATKFTPEGKPKLDDFLKSGKFASYEEALDAHGEAMADWKMAERDRKAAIEASEKERQEIQSAYQDDLSKFGEDHEDFDEAYEVVKDWLGMEPNAISDAIMRSDSPAALIYHLGNLSAKDLNRLSSLPPSKALLELGKIAASFESKAAPVSDKPTPQALPKTPTALSARGTSPKTPDELMRKAAEKAVDSGDPGAGFKDFLAASQAKKKAALNR